MLFEYFKLLDSLSKEDDLICAYPLWLDQFNIFHIKCLLFSIWNHTALTIAKLTTCLVMFSAYFSQGICLMITVLQMARLPNIKVLACLLAAVWWFLSSKNFSDLICTIKISNCIWQVASALLSAAFVYDIFWVFISPLIFNESVMIAVSVLINSFNEASLNGDSLVPQVDI